jgi:RHH-type proline utilization regulon transcriptional repressor/proline dehydrogenase/delta 1-pyrroline-5-carboxylate dehydrogenase
VHRLLSQRPAVEPTQGELSGPVGERNAYALRPKGAVLCMARAAQELKAQHDLVRATGNRIASDESQRDIAAVLFDGGQDELVALNKRLAARDGPIVPVHLKPYAREFLFDEVSLSVNTAAAGGNASLMAIG